MLVTFQDIFMKAQEAYKAFVERVKHGYLAERVKDGVFGAMMDVQLINDVSKCSAKACVLCLRRI